MNALLEAIDKAGSQAKLARLIGAAGQSTVGNWVSRGQLAPIEFCVAIESATGISRKQLRPDDWQKYWPELANQSTGKQEAQP